LPLVHTAAALILFFLAIPVILIGLIISFGRLQSWLIENIGGAVGRTMLYFLKIRLQINDPYVKPNPVIYIINHSSTLDLFIILALKLKNVRYVAKYELLYNPLFFILGKATGQIFIRRQNSEKAVKTLQKAYAPILKNGYSLLIAPEGTRNQTGSLAIFKKGAFRMAMDLKYDIVPIYITGANRLCPGNSLRADSGTIKVDFGPPIDTRGWTTENLEANIEHIREEYIRRIKTSSPTNQD